MKKGHIFILLILAGIILIDVLIPRRIAVLGYHGFTTNKSDKEEIMEIDKFEKEIAYLKKHHYKSITLDDMNDYINNDKKLDKKSVLITFDDGWKSDYELAFDILKKYEMHGVLFYVGSFYDGHNTNFMNQDMLNGMKNNYPNIEIASHSYNMHHDNDNLESKEHIAEDFKLMSNIVDTKYFAYPYGIYNDTYKEVLRDFDYKLAFSFGPNKEFRKAYKNDDKYQVPRLNMSNSMPFWKFVIRMALP